MSKKKSNVALRKLHEVGRRALEERRRIKREKGPVHGSLASLGANSQLEKNRLIDARRFAELYNAKQLDQLCCLGENRGRPLTKDFVRELIRVPQRKDRNKLAKQCAEQAWSMGQLRIQIACLLPGRRYSGAPRMVPASLVGKLVVTEQLMRGIIRWVNGLSSPASENERPPIEGLPGTIPMKLHEIQGMATRLECLCAKHRGQPAKPPSRAKKKRRVAE